MIVIPTYAEAGTIASVLRRTRLALPSADILVVDDGSPDGTADIVRAVAHALGQIALLERGVKSGLGSAYRDGFAFGLARGYDVLIEMDADLSHDPAVIPRLVREIERGADLAIGSRYVVGGATSGWTWGRRMLSRAGNRYANAVLGLRTRDATSGFRAYRAAVLRSVDVAATCAGGYAFQVELTHRVRQAGGTIVEVPIEFVNRTRGESKMSMHIAVEAWLLVTAAALHGRTWTTREGHHAPNADIGCARGRVTTPDRGRAACRLPRAALLLAFVAATWMIVIGSGGAAALTPLTTLDVTYVDTSRSTPATPSSPASDRRVLVTTIRFPTDDPGPLPLIVLAHGLNGHPHMLDELSEAWARAGYVVAAPRFPRANLGTNGKAVLADAAEYPADLSFVISKLLAIGDDGEPELLRGRIDAQHLGVAGISLGGMAVYGLISNTCCRDGRVDAAILMSAVRPPFPSGVYTRQDVPVMLVHGDADTGYRYSHGAYPELAPPKWFVTLKGGRHGPPFEDAPDEFDVFARRVTTAFWDRYLRGEPAAAQRIVDLVNGSGGRASLRRQLG